MPADTSRLPSTRKTTLSPSPRPSASRTDFGTPGRMSAIARNARCGLKAQGPCCLQNNQPRSAKSVRPSGGGPLHR
ncbi:MAG: hypothetical protein F2659_01365 [Actinobacteria bacterium]|nr:hypothetical protein [Actinomycetota bacterium]